LDKERDKTTFALDVRVEGEGSRDRIINLLEKHPQGLTIEEIAEILGYTRNTVYQRLRELFYYQKVIEIRTPSQRLFRLAKFDISVAEPEKRKIRSLEDA